MRSAIRVSICVLACAGGAWAQAVAGSGAVTGFILEGPVDGLPDATVTVSNDALGLHREAVSTDDGAFEIPALPPAAGYRLKVERKGFANWESAAFEIAVGQTRTFRISLQKEKPETEVDVDTVTSSVEANQTGVNNWVDPLRLRSLPASQRTLDPLVLLAPLVNVENSTGRIAFQSQASSNSFLNDGLTTTSGYFGAQPGIGGPLTQNAAQELRVMSATYPAEYGRSMGGVVDAVTPTGSNDFHGTAFDYLRSTDWNSASRFAPGQDLLGKLNQAGVNFGGPILHDRLFFFVNAETLTDHFNAVNQITSPFLADPTGKTILASNCTATAAQCAAAIKFIQSQMNVVAPFSQHWTSGLARLDYRRSAANAFTLEFNGRNDSAPQQALQNLVAPNGGLLGIGNTTEDTRYAKLGWTGTPTAASVNEFRIGLFEDRLFQPASQPGLGTGNVAITVAGATVGSVNPNASSLNEHRYQLVDNLTLTSGSHTIRVGGDLSRTRDYVNSLNTAGAYTYPTLTAFAQDFSGGTSRSYASFAQQFGTASQTVPYKELNIYAQDTWKAIPRLALNFGVRWDKTFLPQPGIANTNYYQTGSIASPNIAFAPRVSLAYMINDDTVIRAGYGFFYAPYQGQVIDALLNGNGLSQTSITVNPTQASAPLFPRVLTFATSGAGVSNLIYSDSKLRNPHTQQATLALEKRVMRDTTLTVSLVNNHATKLWTGNDVNLTAPTKTATYPVYNASGAAVGSYTTSIWTNRNDSKYARIIEIGDGGAAWYNAAAIELRRRMSNGLSVQATYTWSHATSTNTGPLYDNLFPLTSNPGDFSTDKGAVPTDQRHRAVFNWVWQPNPVRNDSWMARYLINGWQFSGIATLASGEPITPTVLVAGNQFSTLPMAYTNSLNGSGGWSRVPFEAIGALQTDAQHNVDARISRTLPFTERIHGVISFEAFNLFNFQRITGLNSVAYIAVTTLPAGVVNGPYTGLLKPVANVGTGNVSTSFPDGTSARRAQLAFRVVF